MSDIHGMASKIASPKVGRSLGLLSALALSLTLTAGCDSDEIVDKSVNVTNAGVKIVGCQTKAIINSGIAQDTADKILKSEDPAVKAKKLGYKKLGKQLTACVKRYSNLK